MLDDCRGAALVLIVIFSRLCMAQTTPDATALLSSVRRTYSSAVHYRLEVHAYRDMVGVDSGNWSNSFQSAAVEQQGRYKFEARGPSYSWLQVSDGTTEWVYNPVSHEYLRQSVPADKQPSALPPSAYFSSAINDTHDLAKDIAAKTGSLLNPVIIRAETLKIDGKDVPCVVVRAGIKYRSGWQSNVTAQATWWIETGSVHVRQIEELWSGSLVKGDIGIYKRITR
jgi:outer membrane lipoprotein-sorting protein